MLTFKDLSRGHNVSDVHAASIFWVSYHTDSQPRRPRLESSSP